MTREVKLSLILGFAVVLGVGVLLSDHLSGARQARLEGLNPETGVQPVATYTPAADVPPLILVDENGRPQNPPQQRIPAPAPGNPRPDSVAPVRVADANSPQPVEPEPQVPLIDRLRERMAKGVTKAVDDLRNGNTPPSAAQLTTGESLDFSASHPIDPAAGFADAQPAPEAIESSINAIPEATPPAEPEIATYTIREGDTLWSIASRQLGDGKRHEEIARLNRDRMGKDGTLHVGASLRLPPRTHAAKTPSKPADTDKPGSLAATRKKNGKTFYTVKSGDTLGGIAAKFLGSSSKYEDILLANASTLKDEDSLEVGMELMIPGR